MVTSRGMICSTIRAVRATIAENARHPLNNVINLEAYRSQYIYIATLYNISNHATVIGLREASHHFGLQRKNPCNFQRLPWTLRQMHHERRPIPGPKRLLVNPSAALRAQRQVKVPQNASYDDTHLGIGESECRNVSPIASAGFEYWDI